MTSIWKRVHPRKPDELYDIIEQCSRAPYLELFARHPRKGWVQWGDEMSVEKPKEILRQRFEYGVAPRAQQLSLLEQRGKFPVKRKKVS